MNRSITLSWAEYDFLWEHYQLGARRPILEVQSNGYTFDERAQLRAEAWKSLAAKGLGKPGAFHRDIETTLSTLARPEWEIDARLHLSAQGPRTSALVAAAGTAAAAGVLEPGTLTLSEISATGMSRAAVGLLPSHSAGTGASITLPARTLDACAARAGTSRDALRAALVSEGLGKEEARKIVEVVGTVIRFGHFGVARTPQGESRVRAGHVVSVYDSPQGRYLFSRRPSGGQEWVTLAPGTDATITRQLDELVKSLA
ncbi:ESX secretion-associated protein EspG [Actinokineospora sp.]|uniref:ESX secretion-associated protein EspG n=1 Tax=Actinokineospora sp. TaxID=1872133 RepID=UPI003D6BA83E